MNESPFLYRHVVNELHINKLLRQMEAEVNLPPGLFVPGTVKVGGAAIGTQYTENRAAPREYQSMTGYYTPPNHPHSTRLVIFFDSARLHNFGVCPFIRLIAGLVGRVTHNSSQASRCRHYLLVKLLCSDEPWDRAVRWHDPGEVGVWLDWADEMGAPEWWRECLSDE